MYSKHAKKTNIDFTCLFDIKYLIIQERRKQTADDNSTNGDDRRSTARFTLIETEELITIKMDWSQLVNVDKITDSVLSLSLIPNKTCRQEEGDGDEYLVELIIGPCPADYLYQIAQCRCKTSVVKTELKQFVQLVKHDLPDKIKSGRDDDVGPAVLQHVSNRERGRESGRERKMW